MNFWNFTILFFGARIGSLKGVILMNIISNAIHKRTYIKTPNIDIKNSLPILAVCAGQILWGLSYIFSKTAMESAAPSQLLSIRFIIAFIFMNLMLIGKKHRVTLKGKPIRPLVILAVIQPVYFYFESCGILYTNATVSGVILSAVPVVSIIFAVILLKEYPTRRQALFCLLPIIGVILITAAGSSLGVVTPIGIMFLLLTCLASASHKIANKKAAEEYTAFERTYFIVLATGVTFTLAALKSVGWSFSEYIKPIFDLSFLCSVLMLSIFCTVVANVLVNYAAGKLSVAKLASFGPLSTLCSMFAGVMFLGEPLTSMSLVGSLLIILGIWQVSKAKSQ